MNSWVQSKFHGHNDGTFTLERVQDVEPILDQNKRWQNEPQQRSEIMGNHIATIPNIIIDRWAKEDGVSLFEMDKHTASKYLRKKLGDPDWRHLRAR